MHKVDLPGDGPADPTDFDTFRQIDVRIGTVLEAAPLEGARKPAIRLLIDFGPAVVNFPPRQIGKFMSEVLTLGFPDDGGAIVLAAPDTPVPNGARLA